MKCPHCSQVIDTFWNEKKTVGGVRVLIIACPKCRTIISVQSAGLFS